MQSDASGSLGFGIFFRGRWCAGVWPQSWHDKGITRDLTFLELFTILGTLWIWGQEWNTLAVTFWRDNQAAVQILNSLSSQSERVMNLIRVFMLRCLKFNILFLARHMPGVQNELLMPCPVNRLESLGLWRQRLRLNQTFY